MRLIPADAFAVVEHFPHLRQPAAVHEHHAVHELHVVVAAGVEHLGNVRRGVPPRLFAQHVLAGLGGPNHPFLAHAGRQRDVDGVDILRRQQLLIAAYARRWIERHLRLARLHELRPALGTAASHGHQRAVARVVNRGPVLTGDVGAPPGFPSGSCVVPEILVSEQNEQ